LKERICIFAGNFREICPLKIFSVSLHFNVFITLCILIEVHVQTAYKPYFLFFVIFYSLVFFVRNFTFDELKKHQ